ncbi:hypothetical protein Bbelb_217580 [Branchiostoma belcheri]|nr:hypothetical protein Bbelb_217580 [Branchiostoma belcheri]
MAQGQGPNERELAELRNKVKRRLTNVNHDKPKKKFNVLVVGMPGHGKSSFINSMIMAVTGTWWEVAHYSQSDSSVTRCLESFVMFDDNCKEADEPHPMPDYKKNIVFWDCAGFPDATDEVYSTIVSLALDGRIPSRTNVKECMDQNSDELINRFRRVDSKMTFDRIVFILSAASEKIPGNLVQAIKSGAQRGHDVPIIVVLSKIDKCPDAEAKKECVKGAQAAFNLIGNLVRFKETSLYCHELTPCDDPCDYRVMKQNSEIDSNLLNIWMSLTDPNIKAIPAPPEPKRIPPARPAPAEPQNNPAPNPPRQGRWSGVDARHSHGFARCKSVVCTPRLAVSGCVHRFRTEVVLTTHGCPTFAHVDSTQKHVREAIHSADTFEDDTVSQRDDTVQPTAVPPPGKRFSPLAVVPNLGTGIFPGPIQTSSPAPGPTCPQGSYTTAPHS